MAIETTTEKILRLKKERNAVILAHNYVLPEIQDIADFAGDSLGLSKQAAATDADVIVFCGVHFMAETAKILSPQKTVLIPDMTAGCPMADMITAEQLADFKKQYPDALVVCYVNSTAEVKALSDYCCTSGNAIELVSKLPDDKGIIFVPDRYLGSYVKERTGKNIILWPGYCPTHARISADHLKELKQNNPDATIMAHPECPELTREVADVLLSTGQMLAYAKSSEQIKFIVATEPGILHALKKQNPEKEFINGCVATCMNMKKMTLDKLIYSLENMVYEVDVPEETAKKARVSLYRMLEVMPETSSKKSN
ncbi:MAG: quinolinate synthase NadA [Sedimentisphaeraceae bacterium JB056]